MRLQNDRDLAHLIDELLYGVKVSLPLTPMLEDFKATLQAFARRWQLDQDPHAFASLPPDVHVQTAAELFEVSESEVTQEQRRRAQAINFGVIYGNPKPDNPIAEKLVRPGVAEKTVAVSVFDPAYTAAFLADVQKNPFIVDECPIHGPWRVGSRMGGLMQATCPKCDEDTVIAGKARMPPPNPTNPMADLLPTLEPQPACHRIGIHIVPVGTKKCQLCGKEI